MAGQVLVVNGPNLNALGTRELEIYGSRTLDEINAELAAIAHQRKSKAIFFQSNHEGALIDRIHQARADGTDFIIINAGGFTHTSVALRDALSATSVRFIEVHLSNVHRRERFRHRSYLADIAVGVITGLGPAGYRYAMEFAVSNGKPA
ncbi:MAG: type II 3-dehydroquinate dehydratase [Burkholderiaceae bacterium]|nr:type II 3-dehydroquinate dehydratase [Burkholderiaceae bacterium]